MRAHVSSAAVLRRRTGSWWLLALMAGAAMVPGVAGEAQSAPWPTDGWATSTPAEQGLDPAPLDALHRAIEAGSYGNTDRLVVVRNGHLVVNHDYGLDYREISRGYTGPLGCGLDACDASWMHDFNYYHPDYHPYYQGRRVHSLQSVTKSVSATALAVALHEGALTDLDAPLLSFFSAYDLSRTDARVRSATLRDLLTMRTGIEWHESDRPLDGTNTTIQLERSDDWIQFTLDQPSDAAPGTKWVYNSGGSQLMAGIVREATGEHLDAYAAEHLFAPLGIRDFYWKKTPRGYPDALGGLYLEALDLAKLGYLYLHDGAWEGRRILPEGWVAEATSRHVATVNAAGWGYGYQWWRPDRRGVDVWAGLGFGGQALLVIPELDVVAVTNAWNVFGGGGNVLVPLIDALIAAAGRG